MTTRRNIYFAYQGLFMAVLLLLFLYQYTEIEGWVPRLWFMITVLGGSLAFLQLASEEFLSRWPVQAALFLGDAVLASVILHWSSPRSDVYLLYLLIIFGTVLTRKLSQSVVVVAAISLLYLGMRWHPGRGFPTETGFWLRMHFLWVVSALLAILSRDTRSAQAEQDETYRERLIQVERLAAIGQLAAEVAHRIKGPLTTIRVNAEVLAHRLPASKETRRELKQIEEEVDHCREILKHLLDLGRIEEMDRKDLDLREPLRLALQAVEARLKRQKVRLALAGLDEAIPVIGDQSLLQEAVGAILHNALDAMPDGGRLEVRAGWTPARWGRPARAELEVRDEGRGIAKADLERIFRPFFTTKGGEGSGLGLSAALRIMEKHGGSIEASSAGTGRGACFTLTLPAGRLS